MTNKEAQIIIGNIPIKPEVLDDYYSITEYQEAKTMAIEALEQNPCEDCTVIKKLSRKYYVEDAYGYTDENIVSKLNEIIDVVNEIVVINDVLDKIRAEIKEERKGYPPSADEYKTINKVLQIIDKYKLESEDKE